MEITRSAFLKKLREIWHSRSKQIEGVGLVIFSLVLGNFAWKLTFEKSLEIWKQNNPPAFSLWEVALQSRGLEEVLAIKPKTRLLRTLPLGWDDEGSVWMNRNPLVFVVFDGTQTPRFFRGTDIEKPKEWMPLGVGWDALMEVLSVPKVVKGKASLKKAATVRRKGIRDPRRIYY